MSRLRSPLVAISATCWGACFVILASHGHPVGALAFSAWVAWPALFNLAKGLLGCDLAHSLRASLIVSVSSALSVLLVIFVALIAKDPQSPLALVFWPLGQFVLLPIFWAVGRGFFEYVERPLSNNSSKPTPLRGAA